MAWVMRATVEVMRFYMWSVEVEALEFADGLGVGERKRNQT